MPADLFIPFRDLEDERLALRICLLIWSETRNQRDGHGTIAVRDEENDEVWRKRVFSLQLNGGPHTCGDSKVIGTLQSY